MGNKMKYIHLHTLQVEDEKFVQICGKSLLWHADSSKSSDYLPLSYQSHFQFHLDHILSSYPILTTKLQYLICSFSIVSFSCRFPHFLSIHYPVAPFPRSTLTTYRNSLIYFSFFQLAIQYSVASFTRTTPTTITFTNIPYR